MVDQLTLVTHLLTQRYRIAMDSSSVEVRGVHED